VLTLKALEQLAISISAQGRYPEAEGIVRNLYEANARIFTSNNLFLIGDVSDLAGVVGAQGRFSESERYYRQALALSERGYGRQDMRTVFMLTQIAYVFRQQSAYLESLAASRLACAGQQARAASLARTSSLGVESGLSASSNCYHGLAFALMGVARHGPGTASPYAAGVPPTIPGLIASGPAGQDTSDQALGLDADQPGVVQHLELRPAHGSLRTRHLVLLADYGLLRSRRLAPCTAYGLLRPRYLALCAGLRISPYSDTLRPACRSRIAPCSAL
jgi:hypothetical protein